jgi:hypothetical protein
MDLSQVNAEALTEVMEEAPVQQTNVEPLPPELFDYEKAKIHINNIIGMWSEDIQEAKLRREERYADLDVDELRRNGDIAEDETFIPDRVIDKNIKRERADIMAFLNAGFRLGIFDCISHPGLDTRQLEREVTRGLTYKGWYREFERTADGALLHGWDFLEIVFDETKALHVGFEHKGFDKVFYNKKCATLQDSERVLVLYEITINRLFEFKDTFGFDGPMIDTIVKPREEGARRNDTIKLYKHFFKYKNCVYISWLILDEAFATNWLKPPDKLRLGIKSSDTTGEFIDEEIDTYPLFTFLAIDDEQEALSDHKGLGFLDSPIQEATTALTTAFVNGSMRSANVYSCVAQDDDSSAEVKQLDTILVPGGIYKRKLDFFNQPAPDISMLTGITYLNTKNAEERGKIATSVSNRKDSRKTAEELKQSSEEQTKITSTKVATFSEFLREVLTFGWRIIQSQALADQIILLYKQVGQSPIDGSPIFQNDHHVISQEFDIRPAGDTDVIQAKEKEMKFQQDWPVFQQIPGLRDMVLIDYIKVRWPERADDYIGAMMRGDIGRNTTSGLLEIIKGTLDPQEIAMLSPQDKQALIQQLQLAQQYASGVDPNNPQPKQQLSNESSQNI